MWDRSNQPANSRLRPWIPALVWAVILFGLSSIPGSAIPEVPGPHLDKLVHGVLYLVLGLACARALRATTSLPTRALVIAATTMCLAYGVTDELHQLFTPRRSADWHDVVADAVGGLAGALVATRLRRATPPETPETRRP